MREELLKKDYIQTDETTIKLIDKSGDESRLKHYMCKGQRFNAYKYVFSDDIVVSR